MPRDDVRLLGRAQVPPGVELVRHLPPVDADEILVHFLLRSSARAAISNQADDLRRPGRARTQRRSRIGGRSRPRNKSASSCCIRGGSDIDFRHPKFRQAYLLPMQANARPRCESANSIGGTAAKCRRYSARQPDQFARFASRNNQLLDNRTRPPFADRFATVLAGDRAGFESPHENLVTKRRTQQYVEPRTRPSRCNRL